MKVTLKMLKKRNNLKNLRDCLNGIKALAQAVEAKDPYGKGHSIRVSYYSKEIAQKLGFGPEEIEVVESAAYLHDIGKVKIPKKILKKKGRLSKQEYQEVKNHPQVGAKILKSSASTKVVTLIKEHHERPDGQGYPDGKKDNPTSLGAKIIAVADAFDAMTTNRPYRSALSIKEALLELKRYSGTQFDPEVVEVFIEIMENKYNSNYKSGEKSKKPLKVGALK